MSPPPSATRGVYRHAELHRLFSPRSVAVIGASQSPGSFGSRVVLKLDEAGFKGPVHPINPKYDQALGRRCYPSVAAVPETPDCVVISVPLDAVEAAVQDAARAGVGGAIIFTSGFSETGRPERAAQQQRIVEIGRASGMRIVGPNCVGLLNFNIGFQATFAIAPFGKPPTRPAIGLISQSGGLGFALAQALEHGTPVSHVLTLGNACDVDVADQIAYLADDPSCSVIACVFEGMAHPARLMEAARIAHAAGKPLVIYKMASGEAGAAAAMSHTGSMAGTDATYRAAFRRAGVVVVDEMEALLESAAFFLKAGRPSAPGVAVLATSGGACVMLADKAEAHGVPLPQPAPPTRAFLDSVVPDFGFAGNPCDVTGQVQASPEAFFKCVDALMADPQYGTVVIPQPHASASTQERLKVFSEAGRRHGKPICSLWMSEWLEGPGATDTEVDPHVALFRSGDRCFANLAAWNARERWMQALDRPRPRSAPADAAQRAATIIAAHPHKVLTEGVAKQVLAAYGIPVVQERRVQSAEAAAAAAREVGFPVAIKVESADLPHKTEAGVVRLGLQNEAQLAQAYAEVMANAAKVQPAPRIDGVLVQPMVGQGVEIIVGARSDAHFGPLVVVGLGGILVELLKDTAMELAPVAAWEAREMLDRLKGKAMLTGFRGSAPVDQERLADIVARLSELIADLRDTVAEVDVNPLICSGGAIVAVDALIVKAGA